MPDLDAIIDAGLDDGGGDAPAPEPTPEPAAPAAETPVAATPAAPADDDTSKFGEHEGYIKELRAENAKYRTERNALQEQYGAAFEGLDPADQATFLEAVNLYKTDPAAAAQWFEDNAAALRAAGQPAPTDEANKPLTRADVDRIFAEREQATQRQQSVAAINAKVTELGLDPTSYAGKALMLRALEEHQGDIAAAHAAITAETKAAADKAIADFVAGKASGAAASANPVPQAGTTVAGEENKPKNAKEAGERFANYLDEIGYASNR